MTILRKDRLPDHCKSSDLDQCLVLLINLDRASDRLQKMQTRLAEISLDFERIRAVDGRALNYPHPLFSAASYRFLHGRRWSPAEVGCYLSHLKAAERLLKSDAKFALILEDDVVFSHDFISNLRLAMDRSDLWDILRLSTVNSARAIPVVKLNQTTKIGISLTREKGAGAYVINRRAAAWIVRQIPIRVAYDIAFDLEYLSGLKAAFLIPQPCCQQTEEVSQIQNGIQALKFSRWRYLTVLPYRTWLEVSRIVLRGVRLLVVLANETRRHLTG
jgi:glycosyl transferase family 25